MTPTRPALRWHGGKWLLAPWIMGFFPSHRIYVEPFGGAASVLLRKLRADGEVYNDLDDDAVNLFTVLRDREAAGELQRLLRLTPFARTEFELAWDDTDDEIERARRLVIRSFMGFGSNAHSDKGRGHKTTGFRANSNRSGSTPAEDWRNYPDALPALVARLQGVTIERRSAAQVMASHDSADTLIYADPPYLHATRSRRNPYDAKHQYRHEMTDADHILLIEQLRAVKGMVVLSGYPHEIYDSRLGDWARFERAALADGARERTEVVWLNPACARRREAEQMPLLEAS